MQSYRVMFAGYYRALERFNAAAEGRSGVEAFWPLFEAISWAVSLDEWAAENWTPEGKPLGWEWRQRVHGAQPMAGLRFARNRTHHQWSDALRLDETGFQFPMRFPIVFFEWVWRPAHELPEGRPDSHGMVVYREWLEGRAARATLAELRQAFAFLHPVVEPRSPARSHTP